MEEPCRRISKAYPSHTPASQKYRRAVPCKRVRQVQTVHTFNLRRPYLIFPAPADEAEIAFGEMIDVFPVPAPRQHVGRHNLGVAIWLRFAPSTSLGQQIEFFHRVGRSREQSLRILKRQKAAFAVIELAFSLRDRMQNSGNRKGIEQ